MKHGRFLIPAALAWPLCLGCAGDRVRIELLEQELRWQEDEISYLQGQLDEYGNRIESCRNENRALKKELGVTDGKPYNPRKDLPSFPRGGDGPKKNNGPTLPQVDPGIPTDPRDLPAPRIGDSARLGYSGGGAQIIPVSAGSFSAKNEQLPTDSVIDKIVINKRLSGGHNTDGRSGDDGILVVFEPQNAAGEFVAIAGETSIVLMDPNLDGEASRIARWDYATDEVVTHFRRTLLGRGVQFELPWPDQRPEGRELRLYVRFITPQGKHLIAEKDIRLRFPGDDRPDRWVKSDADLPKQPAESPTDGPIERINTRPSLTARPSGDLPAAPQWQPYR